MTPRWYLGPVDCPLGRRNQHRWPSVSVHVTLGISPDVHFVHHWQIARPKRIAAPESTPGPQEVSMSTPASPRSDRSKMSDRPTPKPRIYTAGPNGFTAPGRLWHEQVLLPRLRGAGFEPADPWVDGADIARALAMAEGPERLVALSAADEAAGRRNVALIDGSAGVLALLDGVDVDSGTAAEVGYAYARGLVVVGLRTDSRLSADNAGVTVNLQVQHFIVASGGIVTGELDEAIARLVERVG